MNLKYLNIKIGSQFSYFRNLNFQKHYFLGLTGKEPCTIGKSWIRIRGPLLAPLYNGRSVGANKALLCMTRVSGISASTTGECSRGDNPTG